VEVNNPDYPTGAGGVGGEGDGGDESDEDPPDELVMPCETGDAVLDNTNVQEALSTIWAGSNAGGLMIERKE